MDKNKLAAIIQGKARAMCTPEYDKKINEATNIRKGRPTNNIQYYDPDPASFDDYQEYDDMYLSESSQVYYVQHTDIIHISYHSIE